MVNMTTIEVEKGQVISVVWLDSSSLHGWVYSDLVAEPKVIESVGFVAAITPEAVTITSGRCDAGGVVNPLTIPICCIQEFRIIEA